MVKHDMETWSTVDGYGRATLFGQSGSRGILQTKQLLVSNMVSGNLWCATWY